MSFVFMSCYFLFVSFIYFIEVMLQPVSFFKFSNKFKLILVINPFTILVIINTFLWGKIAQNVVYESFEINGLKVEIIYFDLKFDKYISRNKCFS